jgi:uncharacterized protein YciI
MPHSTIEKPAGLQQAHLEFLNFLRKSGEVNMFGAAPYLQTEFGLEKDQAKAIHVYWMKTFKGEGK